MSDAPNTLFLRLEGPLQAWGDNSKFVIRRTMEAPTKSGLIGLTCCAMGLSRQAARRHLAEMNELRMGVRIDRPGTRWWDYHTVGAKVGILNAAGVIKITQTTREKETLVSRREYLCDASFLAALQGQADLIRRVKDALGNPKWPLFLGRKSCPPSRPILAGETQCGDLLTALQYQPWQPRYETDEPPREGCVPCLTEWQPSPDEPTAPAEAEVWYDAPMSFDPPVHEPRLVVRGSVVVPVGEPTQRHTPPPPRLRADYGNSEYRKAAVARRDADCGLCVFCKSYDKRMNVHHITYRRAGGGESQDDLRSLCRLCHDAVTMIEYGQGMGLDRINPCEPRWREQIIAKRTEIIKFRSLETRRRYLEAEEVE